MAAQKLKAQKIAMVIGKTIYLHSTSKDEFLSNKRWVRHEVAHVRQYLELGSFRFILLYLLESFYKGYQHNRFEVEARAKEKDMSITDGIHFV